MAKFIAGNAGGVDLTAFDLVAITTGTPTTMTPTDYVLPNAEFRGAFEYTGNSLTGGTITDITVFSAGKQAYEIVDLLLPVADVDKFINNGNDSQGFLAEIFGGVDILNGSTSADHLLGFAGGDTILGNNGNDTLEGGEGDDRLGGDAGNDSLRGDAGNDTLDGGTGDDSMDGGAGNDQYFVDSLKDVTKDSGPGTDSDTVKSTLSLTIDDSIENLTLLDLATKGTGNASNNLLIGNDQANTLDGLAGLDTMQGGKGNDIYVVDDAGDRVDETGGTGIDTVLSSVTFNLTADGTIVKGDIENLTLTGSGVIDGTGNALNNTITGNDGDNHLLGLANADTLTGGAGNDTLDGGTGNDRMVGGLGNDLFIVESKLDVVVETAGAKGDGEGVDTVQSSISYVLGTFVENLTLVDSILGTLDINGTGTNFTNIIIGNDGKNILDGVTNAAILGVVGGDTLTGGDGDDTYIVHNAADQVIEADTAGSGHDVVQSSITFALAPNVEDLVLTGTAAIDGTGNELANKLTGNAANNKLDGGLGDDTMIGGAGDDSYVLDSIASAKDVITDSSGANDEIFFTGKDLSLVKLYTNIEHYNFSLLDVGAGPVSFTGSTAANRITGTTLNDTLVGGTGNDTLIGGDGTDSLNGGVGLDRLDGGAGDDTMDGGAGNDTYVIDSYNDIIIETGKDTGDTVETGVASLHIDLGQSIFAGIENVTFTGIEDLNANASALTTVNNTFTGNAGDNQLEGLDGNDTLIGGGGNDTLAGGKGSDSMAGGTGDDTYFVDATGDKILEKAGEGTADLVLSVISYVLADNVEDLVLNGGDLNGTGNALANTIVGTDGKNILDGKGGDDVLSGQGGDDTYFVDSAKDQVIEDKAGGHDLIKSTVDYTLSDNVEDLTLIGGAIINGTGNDLDNVLIGNGAVNKLDGGLGADTMKGGANNDTYTVDNVGDKVDETGGNGVNDTVIFKMTNPADEILLVQQLGGKTISGIEHYDFSKFTTDVDLNFAGDAASNKITGTKFGDILAGNGGNDTLDGGLGADSLTGGAGNDTYVIDTLADQIVELKNGGTDTIVSLLADYTLQEPSLNYNFENLTIGEGESGNANGTGNSLGNVLRGNVFDNVLMGLGGNDTMFAEGGDDTLIGGVGNDSMAGGFGSDTYILDSRGDMVIEAAGLGTNDTVIAPFDYTLGANVEDLVLVGTAKNGTGNDLGNHIVGNDLNNILDGKGGIDKLEGGKGDDTYILRSIAETVIEQADEGNDTIKQAWNFYSLAANIENLTFTGPNNSEGFGNGLDNRLTGSLRNDTLHGDFGNDTLDGGAGIDSLIGGNGDDTYVIDNTKDTILEFSGASTGIDTIQGKISIDLNLPAYANVENVTLTGAGALSATGTGVDNHLIGNASANKLIGNDGNDTLDGGGGGDSMVGGLGNDTYVVDSAADKVDETGGTGTDTVLSSVTFNLTAGTIVKGDVENLTLTGTGAINGTGNAFANIIHGNDGANKLDGGGGDDTITGHGGSDQIDVGNGNDTVSFVSVLDGHDVISNFDGDATGGGQDTVDLDALFDSLSIAGADRAGRVTLTPSAGHVDVSVDVSALHDGSNVLTVATLNLANPADAITVGQDVLVGT